MGILFGFIYFAIAAFLFLDLEGYMSPRETVVVVLFWPIALLVLIVNLVYTNKW